MQKREWDNNPVINQDPYTLLAFDTAGRPRHDESCADDFLLQRGVRPKKQWDKYPGYVRPDRGGGRPGGRQKGGSSGQSPSRNSNVQQQRQQQQQNENTDTAP